MSSYCNTCQVLPQKPLTPRRTGRDSPPLSARNISINMIETAGSAAEGEWHSSKKYQNADREGKAEEGPHSPSHYHRLAMKRVEDIKKELLKGQYPSRVIAAAAARSFSPQGSDGSNSQQPQQLDTNLHPNPPRRSTTSTNCNVITTQLSGPMQERLARHDVDQREAARNSTVQSGAGRTTTTTTTTTTTIIKSPRRRKSGGVEVGGDTTQDDPVTRVSNSAQRAAAGEVVSHRSPTQFQHQHQQYRNTSPLGTAVTTAGGARSDKRPMSPNMGKTVAAGGAASSRSLSPAQRAAYDRLVRATRSPTEREGRNDGGGGGGKKSSSEFGSPSHSTAWEKSLRNQQQGTLYGAAAGGINNMSGSGTAVGVDYLSYDARGVVRVGGGGARETPRSRPLSPARGPHHQSDGGYNNGNGNSHNRDVLDPRRTPPFPSPSSPEAGGTIPHSPRMTAQHQKSPSTYPPPLSPYEPYNHRDGSAERGGETRRGRGTDGKDGHVLISPKRPSTAAAADLNSRRGGGRGEMTPIAQARAMLLQKDFGHFLKKEYEEEKEEKSEASHNNNNHHHHHREIAYVRSAPADDNDEKKEKNKDRAAQEAEREGREQKYLSNNSNNSARDRASSKVYFDALAGLTPTKREGRGVEGGDGTLDSTELFYRKDNDESATSGKAAEKMTTIRSEKTAAYRRDTYEHDRVYRDHVYHHKDESVVARKPSQSEEKNQLVLRDKESPTSVAGDSSSRDRFSRSSAGGSSTGTAAPPPSDSRGRSEVTRQEKEEGERQRASYLTRDHPQQEDHRYGISQTQTLRVPSSSSSTPPFFSSPPPRSSSSFDPNHPSSSSSYPITYSTQHQQEREQEQQKSYRDGSATWANGTSTATTTVNNGYNSANVRLVEYVESLRQGFFSLCEAMKEDLTKVREEQSFAIGAKVRAEVAAAMAELRGREGGEGGGSAVKKVAPSVPVGFLENFEKNKGTVGHRNSRRNKKFVTKSDEKETKSSRSSSSTSTSSSSSSSEDTNEEKRRQEQLNRRPISRKVDALLKEIRLEEDLAAVSTSLRSRAKTSKNRDVVVREGRMGKKKKAEKGQSDTKGTKRKERRIRCASCGSKTSARSVSGESKRSALKGSLSAGGQKHLKNKRKRTVSSFSSSSSSSSSTHESSSSSSEGSEDSDSSSSTSSSSYFSSSSRSRSSRLLLPLANSSSPSSLSLSTAFITYREHIALHNTFIKYRRRMAKLIAKERKESDRKIKRLEAHVLELAKIVGAAAGGGSDLGTAVPTRPPSATVAEGTQVNLKLDAILRAIREHQKLSVTNPTITPTTTTAAPGATSAAARPLSRTFLSTTQTPAATAAARQEQHHEFTSSSSSSFLAAKGVSSSSFVSPSAVGVKAEIEESVLRRVIQQIQPTLDHVKRLSAAQQSLQSSLIDDQISKNNVRLSGALGLVEKSLRDAEADVVALRNDTRQALRAICSSMGCATPVL